MNGLDQPQDVQPSTDTSAPVTKTVVLSRLVQTEKMGVTGMPNLRALQLDRAEAASRTQYLRTFVREDTDLEGLLCRESAARSGEGHICGQISSEAHLTEQAIETGGITKPKEVDERMLAAVCESCALKARCILEQRGGRLIVTQQTDLSGERYS